MEANILIAGFVLCVGIVSTLVLDLWVVLLERYAGLPRTDWRQVGRWLRGLASGNLVLREDAPDREGAGDAVLGWCFHYGVGLAYAALLPAIWGRELIVYPQPLPYILIGFVLSTFAGLGILTPCMGGGFMGRLLPRKAPVYAYVLVAHIVFALAQYATALGYALWFLSV